MENKLDKNDSISIMLLKLSPVLILAGLIIVGYDPVIAATAATIYASIIAMVIDKYRFNDLLDAAMDNVKELQLVFFILMAAYAMAEAFMATGVGASIITLALDAGITGRTVAVVAFLVTSILSVATGTSWGTFAASAPIFLWLNFMVNVGSNGEVIPASVVLMLGAIAGGACFGDNIGLISDTTIVSSGMQKVEVTDRIKHQGVWSLSTFVLAVIAFYIAGIVLDLPTTIANGAAAIDAIPADVWANLAEERASAIALLEQVQSGVPLYLIIPLILVLIAAIRGQQTLICLGIGIFSSFIFGSFAGTVEGINAFSQLIYDGFSDAGSWVIIMMMWVAAFSGIMSKMGAFSGVSKLVLRFSKNVRQLMFWNAILSLFGNATLADEMAQIVTVGPIQKELVDNYVEGSEEDKYTLRLRNATFLSSLGVLGSQLIPWHVYVTYYLGISRIVFPLFEFEAIHVIQFNFLAFITVISILLLTLTGLDRFVPNFKLPSEPDVKLKKDK